MELVTDTGQTTVHDLERYFIAVKFVNVTEPDPKQKQAINTVDSIVRFQFTELLVRIAYSKYFKTKIVSKIADAVQRVVEDLDKFCKAEESAVWGGQAWRLIHLFSEEVNAVLTANLGILRNLHWKYTTRKNRSDFQSVNHFLIEDGLLMF